MSEPFGRDAHYVIDIVYDELMEVETPMEELVKFIGGLEKWSILPEDCRMEVVKYLGYEDRCHLERCSKQDYATVAKTPIHIHSISISDCTSCCVDFKLEPFDHVTVKLRFDNKHLGSEQFEILFSQEGEDTQIMWINPFEEPPVIGKLFLKSCNYYAEAVKYAERWMKKCNFEFNEILIQMKKYPWEVSQIKSLPYCKDAHIDVYDYDTLLWWMDKLPKQLNRFTMPPYSYDIPVEFFDLPQIKKVSANLHVLSPITDEQLQTLEANRITVYSELITESGINQFIRQWMRGERADFKKLEFWPDDRDWWDGAKLLEGIYGEEWDREFEEFYEEEFCKKFKEEWNCETTYQILSLVQPYDSITLDIYGNRVLIVKTGTGVIGEDGEMCTEFALPSRF